MATGGITLSGLAKRLVEQGLIQEEKAQQAVLTAQKEQVALIAHLLQSKAMPPAAIAMVVAQEFGESLFDLDVLDPDALPQISIDEKLIRKHNVLPIFKRGNRLFLAVSDPSRLDAVDAIRFNSGLNIETVVVEENKLLKLIDKVLEGKSNSSMQGLDADLDDVDISGGEDADANDGSTTVSNAEDDAPIVRYINKILLDAIKGGASDLHFEPYEKAYRIRFRIDGVLREIAKPPVQMAGKMAARLKVMSQMDISERRIPQDGRIKLKLSKSRAIDFRVNSLPTLFGEKLCLRILDPSSAMLGIDALGYEPDQKALFMDALDKPQGMLLITGPTGSGKTVSLYTGLNILNTEETNISTAEDPVEINLEGINQVNVNTKVGLTFATALKAFLRQDPDVIMLGEIRDLETAEIAVKAAQTGHMVLSTLHTNDAPQTISRMMNMGIAPFNIISSVTLVIAQRLARRLCPHCKKPMALPEHAMLAEGFSQAQIDAGVTLFEAVGCDQCNDGYKGRTGIYQVMPLTEEIQKIILEGGNSMQIGEAAARSGVNDLRKSAMKKCAAGTISLVEANRVTKD